MSFDTLACTADAVGLCSLKWALCSRLGSHAPTIASGLTDAVVLQHGTTDRCGMLSVPKTFVCSTGEMVVLVCRCRQRGCKYIPRKLMVLDGTGCLGAEGRVVR
jgi:hypothetical protein